MEFKHSVARQFRKYMFVIIVVSNFLVYGLNVAIMQGNFRKQIQHLENTLMSTYLVEIEQYFSDIDQLADTLVFNREIIAIMKDKINQTENSRYLKALSSQYYMLRPDLRISFFKEGQYTDYYSIFYGNIAKMVEDYRTNEWYKRLKEDDVSKVIINDKQEDGTYKHSIFYRVKDEHAKKTVGYLQIDMELDRLKKRLFRNDDLSGITIREPKSGEILFSERMEVEIPPQIRENKSAGSYENRNDIFSWQTSESTNWEIAVAMSKKEMHRNFIMITVVQVLLLIFIIALTLLVTHKSFASVTSNFRGLIDGMRRVKEGNLTVQVESTSEDEISFLIHKFNSMVRHVEELMHTVEQKQNLLNAAETQALQQQINPHFIYNTLNIIMGLASEGMDDDVITVSQSMGEMLRYNMKLKHITRLEDEIWQVKNYIQIMSIRYENRFETHYEIDEACLAFGIVKFSLQPVVENAITHGLSEYDTGGVLRIRIKKRRNYIFIAIADNGVGISPEKLQQMNEAVKVSIEKPLEYVNEFKSLGFINVHLRLKLYYGQGYSMHLFSKLEKGTCVCMRIPAKDVEITGDMIE
ncbi:MAG: histidine kinase [Lachnospiraceae bacterium]